MAYKFKDYHWDQDYLFPQSMRDWLPSGDLAYFIMDIVKELDLREIYKYYKIEENKFVQLLEKQREAISWDIFYASIGIAVTIASIQVLLRDGSYKKVKKSLINLREK